MDRDSEVRAERQASPIEDDASYLIPTRVSDCRGIPLDRLARSAHPLRIGSAEGPTFNSVI